MRLWRKTCQQLKVARGWELSLQLEPGTDGKTSPTPAPAFLWEGDAYAQGIRSGGGWKHSPLSDRVGEQLAHPSLDLPILPSFFTFLGDDMREMQLSPGVGSPPGPPGDLEDDEGLKHLQQV